MIGLRSKGEALEVTRPEADEALAALELEARVFGLRMATADQFIADALNAARLPRSRLAPKARFSPKQPLGPLAGAADELDQKADSSPQRA